MMFDTVNGITSQRPKALAASLTKMEPSPGKQQSNSFDPSSSKRNINMMENQGNPKRLRDDDGTRNLLNAHLSMQQQHAGQQINVQHQQQLEQQLHQPQQAFQQQQQFDHLNFLGRQWGGNGGVDQTDFLLSMLSNSGGGQGSGIGQSNSLYDESLRRAELSAQLFREHAARSQLSQNAAARFASMENMFPTTAGGGTGGQGGTSLNWASLQQQNTLQQAAQAASLHQASSSQQAQQLALRSFTDFDSLRQGGNLSLSQVTPSISSLFNNSSNGNDRNQDIATLLRQMQSSSTPTQSSTQQPVTLPSGFNGNQHQSSSFSGILPGTTLSDDSGIIGVVSQQPSVGELELPPCEEGLIGPYTNRASFHLGIDEDPNWLSEFHCFVRSELIEVFRASNEDVKARNNSIAYHQVGIRCRFCAHMTPSARAGRSSAFPSSLRQIYQSFTMMLRDHFGNCDAMPSTTQEKFMVLKDKPAQGATDSKRYWMYSAMKIGMTDSAEGIIITEQTRSIGARTPPFGASPGQRWEDDAFRSVPLVLPSDRPLVSEFLYVLMTQVQPIRLMEAECIGNRRSLRVGLPGFGCRFCCESRRLGLCRMFPARRRTLPTKVNDVYDHLRRCTVCPESVKIQLERTKHQMNIGFHADQGGDREFFDKVWNRLGHESQTA